MSLRETQIDKKCPNCGRNLFQWHLKNPFIDDVGTYCKHIVSGGDGDGEYCYGSDPSYGFSSARANARAEERSDREIDYSKGGEDE